MRLQPAGAHRAAACGDRCARAWNDPVRHGARRSPRRRPRRRRPPSCARPRCRTRRLRLGQRADVRGRLAASDAGRRIALQYAPRGRRWRPLATPTVEAGGRYRFRVRLKRSGALRIALRPTAAPTTPALAGVVAAEAAPASRARRDRRRRPARRRPPRPRRARRRRRCTCAARCCRARAAAASSSRPARDGRWHAVAQRAHARERPLRRARRRRARPARSGCACASPATAATPARAPAPARCRRYRRALASWYGALRQPARLRRHARHGTLGVANKSLPCGTQGHAAPRRPRRARAGDRPRPVRRRARVRPDRRDRARGSASAATASIWSTR